jgi:hypothetical protein
MEQDRIREQNGDKQQDRKHHERPPMRHADLTMCGVKPQTTEVVHPFGKAIGHGTSGL